jgi:hypothetical protein
MRRFGLVGVALVLMASSASAQQVVQVTTFREGRTKTTVIGPVAPVGPPTLDQLSQRQPAHGAPQCPPTYPLCCMLPDQPALLYRLAVMNALHTTGVGIGVPAVPKLDELPRPTPQVEEKKIEERKVEKAAVRESPLPATMLTLDATDWYCGRCFTDDCGRRWCLLKGCALPDKLPHMRGWLLESDGKKLYFVHEGGNIYTRLVVPTLP